METQLPAPAGRFPSSADPSPTNPTDKDRSRQREPWGCALTGKSSREFISGGGALSENQLFATQAKHRCTPDHPTDQGLKPRPDKENPGPEPLQQIVVMLTCFATSHIALSAFAVHVWPLLHVNVPQVPHLHGYVELVPPATLEQTACAQED